MVYPKIPLAQSVIEIFRQQGIQHIVISPGSRNAPLTLGFTLQSFFTCYSIADERSAAFFALGLAQQLQKPVAVVCTSGSAVLNYYPAVAEAFYSQIPLIVVSADRPASKIDIGDGQTIRQSNVLSQHTVYNANLTEMASVENELLIYEALEASMAQSGPVHLNVPFEEPLYETVPELTITVSSPPVEKKDVAVHEESYTPFVVQWNKAQRKLVLVGVHAPHSIAAELWQQLMCDPSVLVMTESTSNLHHPDCIDSIDTLITPFDPKDIEAFQPEILLTFGGMVVSKRIKALLRNHTPQAHWHIDPLRAYDTYGCLTHHFKTTPSRWLSAFLPQTQAVTSSYRDTFLTLRNHRRLKAIAYLADLPFCDLKVFEKLLPKIPPHTHLQVSNSSAIRYAQLFATDSSVEVFCNRGTSGIDGSTSTAIGAAVASGVPTTLITGDISFLYDSNALWNAYIPKTFTLIVINNGGGGIFRILPGHEETPTFNTFFETSHCFSAQHLAAMYGLDYHSASSEPSLEIAMATIFGERERPQLLEIFTPTQQNDHYLRTFFKSLV
ncbi:2-succinyl-5-enolpyruvyl-6-hydroxy-3-cyclohexene-1-carboxylic-acid synthase [Flavobacterium sp.]|jgi:2-succinyl-5-enolpyruvyl-6-hydroxy-3-cyclohexene-1-carboxylate synthase|uniref:2-succinyl-5-enolpyruvyl-6-hydroxy-3- cyclohexene-1-carboxylic-acid synthase n=1 Tax=Flavobacterium sp. TaxID=239 RepID=UPI0022BBC5B0|nr:2-succinyl-5-enolpyruvyl-6-hydroxy-3-cyclohexene-1-carboxylic-acid synthase [Flavobacterium sp.]MCZ8144010.1 2-succinyl-5-enolpyruvyl-6-hydroxy-3-cyclohexene-1-carboxylic-acid synthase [Flavobacterium sp.]MCZ8366495.1 2-succinyl-5-enolpyruvyl-6-hydroxy-3-cyclohexene-1-carboxylic-acid synthase [Flavobacterium sp.]